MKTHSLRKFDAFDALVALSGHEATLYTPDGGRHPAASLAQALSAIERAGRRAPLVAIAAESVFAQTVSLPEAQTSGLSQQELDAALFYEVEPFCGIAPGMALTATVRAPDGQWRVAVVEKPAFAEFEAKLAAARCKLWGVCPTAFLAQEDDTAVFSGIGSDGGEPFERRIPVIRPARSAMSGGALAKTAAAATAAVAVICAADWLALTHAEARLSPVCAACETLAAENSGLRSQIAAHTARVEALRRAAEKRTLAEKRLRELAGAWPGALAAIESAAQDSFVILSATPTRQDNPEERICGADFAAVSPTPDAAAAAMANLEAGLSEASWRLDPGQIECVNGGAVARFSFSVGPMPGGGR
ncbi:MAG: hypothetical protein IJS46_02630 [Kiritimatiellae bacterium]|nr:hypothetical protein [Kiritimatiellia bacterium]